MQLTELLASSRRAPALRLILGLVQGLYLLILYQAAAHGIWPATDLYVFLPLVQLGLYLPLAAIVCLGHIKPRATMAWLGVLAVVIVGLGVHAVYAFDLPVAVTGSIVQTLDGIQEAAFISLFVFLPIGLLIAHTLFVAVQTKTTQRALYEDYFELAWKHGIQVVAAGVFTGVFWLLLALGIGLFTLIEIKLVDEIIGDPRFAIPATALVVALALHITDVRPGIIAGMRTLALTLLSWLLPVLVVLIVSFLAVLPFAGIELLWRTNFATALLHAASAALVILINAVYQDGPPRAAPPQALKLAAAAGALALVPLALLAGFGLGLRVAQYGWTADRIIAAACVVVAVGYAGGYAFAVFKRGAWLQDLERVNVAMSYAVLAVLIALFSPIADPVRISVASQVDRLKDGRIAPEAFDVDYLRFQSGRYGVIALNELKDDPVFNDAFKKRAVAALARKRQFGGARVAPDAVTMAANIEALPRGKVLPESFLRQNWKDLSARDYLLLPECMRDSDVTCHALVADLDRDGVEEVVVLRGTGAAASEIFKQEPAGTWSWQGRAPFALACPANIEALRAGAFTVGTSAWDDVVVGDRHYNVDPGRATPCESLDK